MTKFRESMARAVISAKPAPYTQLNIDTREELLNALQEAVQIEHGLMLQYLFAAFSCKRRVQEGLTENQVEAIRRWQAMVLRVAREEMAHLGTVCNLLNAFGGTPDLSRPNFPQAPGKWFPFEFRLEKLSPKSIARFIRFESPESLEKIAILDLVPDPIEYDFVGELYRGIKAGIQRISRQDDYKQNLSNLFIGDRTIQDSTDWSGGMSIFPITSVESALSAIDFVVAQGEGIQNVTAGSHFAIFNDLAKEYMAILGDDRNFEPARDVVDNPATATHKETSGATLIEPTTLAYPVAGLANHVYTTVLMLLLQFFNPAGETKTQREGIQAFARRSMSGIIRPLAEILTVLPATSKSTGPFAGAPFEIYGSLDLPAHTPARFSLILERVEHAAAEATRLSKLEAKTARIEFISGNLRYLAEGLRRVYGRD